MNLKKRLEKALRILAAIDATDVPDEVLIIIGDAETQITKAIEQIG